MEAAPPEVIVTVSEEAVESGPNSFILFLIFLPTFLIAYLIPFLATLYSKNNARKWIFYWIAIILASLVLRPVLNFILGAYGGAFMFLVVAAVLLYTSNNEKVIKCLCSLIFWWMPATFCLTSLNNNGKTS